MNFKLLTPEGIRYEGETTSVTVKTSEGYMTIFPKHSPVIASISPCKLSWKGTTGAQEGAIAGGILTVSPEEVNIISDAFEFIDQIDIRRAQLEKETAEKLISQLNKTDDASQMKRAQLSLAKAANRLALGK